MKHTYQVEIEFATPVIDQQFVLEEIVRALYEHQEATGLTDPDEATAILSIRAHDLLNPAFTAHWNGCSSEEVQ